MADPTYPLAAQIALKSFTLPEFATDQSSRLRELTLTADLKLDEYQGMVQSPPGGAVVTQPPLPELPASITHLTLELFGLGFPGTPPFLTRLARALPNLASVTFFSCLVDGLDGPSRADAENFFAVCGPRLREVHFIDSFARPGFFAKLGEVFAVAGRLNILDVSYTFRGHEDSDFLARVQGEELSGLLVKGLVAASFDFIPEARDAVEMEGEGDGSPNQGILPFASDGRAPTALKSRLAQAKGELGSLKVLNLAMWSLRPVEVVQVVDACAGALVDLTLSVLLEDDWVQSLADALQPSSALLEGIEIVGVPKEADGEGTDWKKRVSVVEKADVDKIAAACPKLSKFDMSILKVKSAPNVVFLKEGGAWVKQ